MKRREKTLGSLLFRSFFFSTREHSQIFSSATKRERKERCLSIRFLSLVDRFDTNNNFNNNNNNNKKKKKKKTKEIDNKYTEYS